MGLLSQLLGAISGNSGVKVSEQLLFDKVIGFKSIVPGCGASLMVQNIAIALSETTKYNICVLDTNFLYPVQYPMLCSGELKVSENDILTFTDDLSKARKSTMYSNVYLVQLDNRNIIDMLSGKDSEVCVTNLIAQLKSYFDIVLVDLSNEFTNISQYSAIKCNKIFLVADTSLKCIYNIKKSLNTIVTLGIPLAKSNKVILNKELPDVVLGMDSALTEAGLEIVAKIPLSYEIAILAASGKKLYGAISKDKDISIFNEAIDGIVNTLLEKTPLNAGYMDVRKELAKIDEENRKQKEKDDIVIETSIEGTEIINSFDDSIEIMDELLDNENSDGTLENSEIQLENLEEVK